MPLSIGQVWTNRKFQRPYKNMSLKLCPHCMNRLHKLIKRCDCGYDFEQRKVIAIGSLEERKAIFIEDEKTAVQATIKIAIKTMLLGGALILFGIFALSMTTKLVAILGGRSFEYSLGGIIVGVILFAKGLNNYFTGEVEEDLSSYFREDNHTL
jgi:hypothetical protein